MKTRLSIPAILALIALTIASPARAQNSFIEPGEWTISPMLGVAFVPDADTTLSISGAVDYHFTSVLAFEGELGHLFDLVSDNPNVDASLTTVHGSLLYIFDSDFGFRPYLAAGLGAGHYSVTVRAPPNDFDQTELGFNLGGGAFFPLDDRLGVRADFRYFKHIDEVPTAWRLSGGVTLGLSR